MVGGVNTNLINSLIGSTLQTSLMKSIGLITLFIVTYSLFVFYFYRFLAKKNIINLNLTKYNQYEFGTVYRFFAIIFFILEYLIILPFITFFWFGILSILMLILSKGIPITQILIISASLIGAIRITSFVSEDLSRDLAKMIPLALLALAITSANFNIELILEELKQIPSLLTKSVNFLIFIIGIEIIMRLIDFVLNFFRKKDTEKEEEE